MKHELDKAVIREAEFPEEIVSIREFNLETNLKIFKF